MIKDIEHDMELRDQVEEETAKARRKGLFFLYFKKGIDKERNKKFTKKLKTSRNM